MLKNEWNYVAEMNLKRNGHAAVTFCGKIYVFGGDLGGGIYSKSLEIYDPITNHWELIPISEDINFRTVCKYNLCNIYNKFEV